MNPVRPIKKLPLLAPAILLFATACGSAVEPTPTADVPATEAAVEATRLAVEAILSATATETATLPPTETPIPSATATRGPTKTPTPLIPNCTRWDRLSRDMVGEEVCVYGVISQLITGGSQSIIFQDLDAPLPPVEFRFLIIDAWYPDLKEGQCIRGEGVLRENGPTSYLFINTSIIWSYRSAEACKN
ncbi:MAG: hypothetical protein HYZ26_14040 [Chloroflexi bacterium]|nr:hypothetical protein [Chloroflexota bacterium]